MMSPFNDIPVNLDLRPFATCPEDELIAAEFWDGSRSEQMAAYKARLPRHAVRKRLEMLLRRATEGELLPGTPVTLDKCLGSYKPTGVVVERTRDTDQYWQELTKLAKAEDWYTVKLDATGKTTACLRGSLRVFPEEGA